MNPTASTEETASPVSRYQKTFTVHQEDIDLNGHVGNLRYMEWFLEVATEHSEKLGMGFETLKKMGRTWVAKEHHIRYKRAAMQNDLLELETWLQDISVAQGIRKYVLRNAANGELICEGETHWVFVELESYRPKRIPEAIRLRYEAHTL